MSLEQLVEEVRRRSEEDLQKEVARFADEARKLLDERAKQLQEIAEGSHRIQEIEVARVRSGRIAGAKLAGRRLVFEARQKAGQRALDGVRSQLVDLAASDDYAPLLRRMYSYAVGRFGKTVRLSGRPEDAALLRSLAGKGTSPRPISVIGGFIAESSDGSRRLDLSFDELLRRREDRVLELVRAPEAKG